MQGENKNNVISNNIISGGNRGIDIGCYCDYNKVYSNTISNCSTAIGDIYNSRNEGNEIYDNDII